MNEPRWFNPRLANIPKEVKGWLLSSESLTAKLRKRAKESFQVHLISQAWQRPFFGEAKKLGLSKKPALIRQVELICDQKICVFARSIFPAASLVGKWACLAHLGNYSLGDILFADPLVQREAFEIAHLHHAEYEVWARRSVFRRKNKSILVSEFFNFNNFSLAQ